MQYSLADLVLVLEYVLGVDGVPDADFARLVGGGDVESNADINIDICDRNGDKILEDDSIWTCEIDCMI